MREPKYLFIRDKNNFPAGCLAYTHNKEDGKILFGYSIYHPDDEFDRSLARHIAKQRLIKRPQYHWDTPGASLNQMLHGACAKLQKKNVPTRFKAILSHMKKRLVPSQGD